MATDELRATAELQRRPPCSHGPDCQLPWSVHDWSYEADWQKSHADVPNPPSAFYEDHDRDMADPEYAEAYRQATAEVTTTTAARYVVELDRDGAEWLAAQAGDLGRRTKDYGWTEIAETLEEQLAEGTAP